jgi:hypothetical protein
MSVIPCEQNAGLRDQIEKFAEVLKTHAHELGDHGLDEKEFYNSGLFRGAIERIRGQYSATMRPKREFVQHVLNHMEDGRFIEGWDLTEAAERSDYWVRLPAGRNAVIALTGGMDGNNVTLFERPETADEFVIWSMMTNAAGDPRRNAWSGIHTRLSAEMISRDQQVDGVIVWDMVCGTVGRPCPKIIAEGDTPRLTDVGPFRVPPHPASTCSPRSYPGERSPRPSPSLSPRLRSCRHSTPASAVGTTRSTSSTSRSRSRAPRLGERRR